MAAVNPPFVLGDQMHPGDVFRRMVRALRSSQGCVSPGDLLVAQSVTPAMNVTIAAGLVVIDGTQDAVHQGSYVCLNDATMTLAIAASDPTNPRIDSVIAKVQDSQYSGGTDAWFVSVVTGTPAPSPVAPALPPNNVLLANVAVAALATTIVNANITDKRLFVGSTPYRARAYANAVQSIPASTFTKIALDTVSFDPNGNVDLVNHRYVAPVTGYYRVTGTAYLVSAQPSMTVKLYVNGSPVTLGMQGTLFGSFATDELHLNAGDYVEIFGYQASGGAVNTSAGSSSVNYLTVEYAGS